MGPKRHEWTPNEAGPHEIPTQNAPHVDFYKLIDLEISCQGPWLKKSEGSYASSYGPGRFCGFLTPHTGPILDQGRGPSWTRHGAHPGLSLDQARGSAWTRLGPTSSGWKWAKNIGLGALGVTNWQKLLPSGLKIQSFILSRSD